jgi:hypothetical protein
MVSAPRIYSKESGDDEIPLALAEFVFRQTRDELVARQVYYEYNERDFEYEICEGFLFWVWKYHPDLVAGVTEILPGLLKESFLTISEFVYSGDVAPWLWRHWQAIEKCAVVSVNGYISNNLDQIDIFLEIKREGKRRWLNLAYM